MKLIVLAETDAKDYYRTTYSQSQLNNIFDHTSETMFLDIENPNANRVAILKIILDSLNKKEITLEFLQALAEHVSKQEFEDFCARKELDLTEDKFKKLDLSQYKYEELEPVVALEEGQNKSLLNLLLSRTFTDSLTKDEVTSIYSKLYHLDPIAKEMLTYTAALISQNNSIKIIFAEDTSSFYMSSQNIIKVSSAFKNEKIFNIESVTIHEIGHFVYDQLFKFDATPFNFSKIVPIIKLLFIEREQYEFFYNEEIELNFLQDLSKNDHFVEQLVEAIKPIQLQYLTAAKQPVDKVVELLSLDDSSYDKYLGVNAYTEHLKFYSHIDLFFLNSANGISTDKHPIEIPNNVFHSILNVYLSEHSTCPDEYPYFENAEKEISKKEVITWASEEFLPKIIAEFGFSPNQIHFLERMADYINRGEHLLSESQYSHSGNGNEKYAELIVRAMELKAAGLDQELVETFKGLEEYHIDQVSPDICLYIQNSPAASLAFDIDMPSDLYACLHN